MKASMHNSRNGSAKHNDRDFSEKISAKDKHINRDLSYLNIYHNIYNDNSLTFAEAERKYYTEHYSDQLKTQNKKYKKAGHEERQKNVTDLLKSKRTMPEETILQIGGIEGSVDLDLFTSCVKDFVNELEKYSENCHVLDVAIHGDEETPHAHIRKVWDYVNEEGNRQISQNKALEALKIPIYSEDFAFPKTNTRKHTFDDIMREKWYDICEEHGITIEREPDRTRNDNKTKDAMIIERQARMIEQNEKTIQGLNETIERQEQIIKDDHEEIERMRKELEKEEREKKQRQKQNIQNL